MSDESEDKITLKLTPETRLAHEKKTEELHEIVAKMQIIRMEKMIKQGKRKLWWKQQLASSSSDRFLLIYSIIAGALLGIYILLNASSF